MLQAAARIAEHATAPDPAAATAPRRGTRRLHTSLDFAGRFRTMHITRSLAAVVPTALCRRVPVPGRLFLQHRATCHVSADALLRDKPPAAANSRSGSSARKAVKAFRRAIPAAVSSRWVPGSAGTARYVRDAPTERRREEARDEVLTESAEFSRLTPLNDMERSRPGAPRAELGRAVAVGPRVLPVVRSVGMLLVRGGSALSNRCVECRWD